MKLKRGFSPLSLLLLSINGMIGSAWLFAPLYAAKISGPSSIIAWLIAGGATALIALTFAELSVLLPVAGGTARFPQMTHGSLTGFIISWVAWLSSITMAPIEVQAVLQYASTYLPGLTHKVDGIPLLTAKGGIYAAALMLFISIVNVWSFKWLVRFNSWLFTFKIVVIVATIAILTNVEFHPQNFTGFAFDLSASNWHAILTAVATGGVAFAFTGFKHGVELAGEAKNTRVAIPLAIVGSVLCCLLLYLGLQIAFIGALDPSTLLSGWKDLSFANDVGPFAGLASALGLVWLLRFLYMDAVISPLGAGLIYATSTSRILFAMSKNGYFPSWLSKLNKEGFPYCAIGVNFALGMFLFLPFPGWQAMVSFLVSAMVLSYAMGPVALLCLRLQLPTEKSQFRLPYAQVLCLIAFYFCTLISYWTGWETIAKLDIAILIGLAFFALAYKQGKLNKETLDLRSGLWLLPYVGGLSLISYLGSFGGINIIPFGWDFLILALFSAMALYLAVVNRRMSVGDYFNLYKQEEASSTIV